MDVELWHRSGHYDNYRENMFFAEPSSATATRSAALRAQADELPRRLPRLRRRAPLLPRPAAAAGRVRPRLPLRARGRAARPAPGPRLHPGRRPRLLHARADRRRGRSTSARRSTSSTRRSASTTSASSSRPARRSRSAPTSDWEAAEEALHRRARSAGPRVPAQPRRRRVLRPEDRLPRDRCPRPLLAARHLPARLPDAGALRPQLSGRRQRRPPAGDDPPGAAGLDGALRRDPDRAPRRPLSRLAGARPGGRPSGRRPPQRRCAASSPSACARAACAPRSTSARESVGRKIRDAELAKVPYMLVVGDREAEASASRVRSHADGDLGASRG